MTTGIWQSDDAVDTRRALTAEGLLATFNEAGVLEAADIHVARHACAIAGEPDPQAALALALTVRAVRHGSICLALDEVAEIDLDLPWPDPVAWLAALRTSPLVSGGVLSIDDAAAGDSGVGGGALLYLERYRRQEEQVADDLAARAAYPAPVVNQSALDATLARLYVDTEYVEQREACAGAATRWTTVLTGGPGTGKTTTVKHLLEVLTEQVGPGARIALAAPTGKAAARLQEQVGLPAVTLHRLLGFRRDNQTRFRHDRSNRLPHDIVVVDETSMVSLTMMARLLEAVRPDARLVLVGDPDQLASIEAGAVLGDLVDGYRGREGNPANPVVELQTVRRYGTHIGELAAALRAGDADAAVAVLQAGHAEVRWLPESDEAIRNAALPAALAARECAVAGDIAGALAALDKHRLLCAHRDTVGYWNRRIERWLSEATGDPLRERMYAGRPLLVTRNDPALGVHNGDTGVVVRTAQGTTRVVLASPAGPIDLAPNRLSDVETMHALTIHKSQGSQAEEVTVVLPDEDSRLLTRELLYTAVTRASGVVRIVGSEDALRAAISRRAHRASGLKRRLSGSLTY